MPKIIATMEVIVADADPGTMVHFHLVEDGMEEIEFSLNGTPSEMSLGQRARLLAQLRSAEKTRTHTAG